MDWTAEKLIRLWGKTSKSGDVQDFHPALFHMLDVAQVARILLSENASFRWRRVLADTLGTSMDSLQSWLPWLIALHDIGKISESFQGLVPEQKHRLQSEGFSLMGRIVNDDLSHSQISEVFIASNFQNLPDKLHRAVREMAAGHHGFFSQPGTLANSKMMLNRFETAGWDQARKQSANMLEGILVQARPDTWPEPKNVSCAVMALTGFTILCDWLGSDQTCFQTCPEMSIDEYLVVSKQRADQVVERAGFTQNTFSVAAADFSQLFPDKTPTRPLQAAIDAIPTELLSAPCLAVIEAPTGEGKTEAALALAHRIAQATGTDELYYALPTTATSNQMFGRLQIYISNNLQLGAQIKLVHGQAFLYEDDLRIQPLMNGSAGDSGATIEWFTPKKRALLAPFGVGTIDQAELAALNVRHVPLRMIGLAGKVIIVDEVHAYDVYMTTIIERLLEWLAALGTSIILLSATLPKARRARLAKAYNGSLEDVQTPESYPCIWIVGQSGSYYDFPPASHPDRQINLFPSTLHFSDDQADKKAKWLIDAVDQGGCACWMTNTVRRAQLIFEAVERLAPPDVDRTLIHAQFPLDQRQELEQEVSRKYGPGYRSEQGKGIVIGTQVLEQSLDLDFDVMVTDLAPIDLILQRAGRLHRHHRARPKAYPLPYLWINTPLNATGIELGVDKHIYSHYILLQTWNLLKERTLISLPNDYRPLIEAVYGAGKPDGEQLLLEAWQELQREESLATGAAQQVMLPEPNPDDPFSAPASQLEFIESETKSSWIVARTRLGEESLTIIPLERRGDVAFTDVDGGHLELRMGENISISDQLKLLRRSIRVSNRRLIDALKNRAVEQSLVVFKEAVLLKDVQMVWLQEGRASFTHNRITIHLILDQGLGLIIQSEKGE